MRLKSKRWLAQIAAFAVSNLGFLRALKTGFVCPFLYCHGCPFAALGCPIGILQTGQTLIINGQIGVLLFTLGSLGVYGMIFGRAFCGWACPFGSLHDILSPTKRRKEVKTRNYWYVKYGVLLLTLVLAWITLGTVFCEYCPSGSLLGAIPYRLREYFLFSKITELGQPFYIHIVTLLSTVGLALLISRFWCRYLCPLGAIVGSFNKLSLTTIDWDESKCTRCGNCLDACVMGLTRMEEIGSSTDCILCGRCVEACTEESLSFKARSK